MNRQLMDLPKVMGDETTDTRTTLEALGFTITSDENAQSYTALAPDGWTKVLEGRDGAVYNQNGEPVIWLWRKLDYWDPVYTMRLHA